MQYPLLNAFLTMLYFFIWILWIFLVIRIVFDIFRSRDLGGWGKASWLILVIILPFLGVFIYVLARGGSMHERDVEQAKAQNQAFQAYVRDAAGKPVAWDHYPYNRRYGPSVISTRRPEPSTRG